MFEQTFKNIDDILYKDEGADGELDYISQTSWVMFLRYLDELEQDKADEAALQGKKYNFIIDEEYRWPVWAMPKTKDGKSDIHKAMTGKDLVEFVDHKLFPYLAGFKLKADNPQTIEYKIGEIFSELKNKVKGGYNLREIIELADGLPFRSSKDKHELSHLYESKIKNMGNAGRNGGQYYTPRPLIRAMIEVIQPKIGERIYDGACGSAGFLCEAFEYLIRSRDKLTTTDLQTLQTKTFYGKEKKNLAYIIGIMNMILHGIEAPNIIHTNTLSENIRDIQEKDRYDIILANPPFGGSERKEVQQNFDIKSGETAFLFLQHFIKNLKAGGRAAIVIKNTFLSNTDAASLRKHLLETCTLHTILDMPQGAFTGAGVKTVVLFFTKGEPTNKIWYYQFDAGRNMGKTNSLNDEDMKEFVTLSKTKPETEKSWVIKIADVKTQNYDLSVKNPNTPEEVALRSPKKILEEIQTLDDETNEILFNHSRIGMKKGWEIKTIGDVCERGSSNVSQTNLVNEVGKYPIFGASGLIKNISFYHQDKPYLSIVKDGSGVGRVTKMDAYTSVIGTLQYILPKENIDLDYLFYSLISVDFKKYVAGAAIPHIYFRDYKNEPFLWMPLPEQKRIVAILDEAFAAIAKAKENTEKNLKNAKQLFESYLQDIFSNVADNWVEKELGEVCSLFQGIAINSKTKHALVEKSDLPLLRIKDLKNNTVEQYIDPNNYPKNALVKEEDIIYTRTGSLGLVFRGKKGVLHNNSFKVVPNSELTRDFLFIWLQNPIFKSKILGLALKAAQPDITHAIFKMQKIDIPPINEQNIIVQKLDILSAKTEKLEAIYQQKLIGLEELKKSILEKAFKGELKTAMADNLA